MASSLIDFLEELDTNSNLMEAYKKNPVATAAQYGLSDEDVTLIEEQNWDEVKRRFDDVSKANRVVSY
ncbi:hypothetical protein ACOJR9_14075 [Alteromonas sp. A081]|uniref:hypothetical protein n=1 Tax=Alteromonas sp. A081 TaxID=3410269 RepID=UPI003B97E64F